MMAMSLQWRQYARPYRACANIQAQGKKQLEFSRQLTHAKEARRVRNGEGTTGHHK